jgi:hypothetical protein
VSDQQTNEQKARDHLKRAEKRNAFVAKLEAEADKKIESLHGAELAAAEPGARVRMKALWIKKDLEGDELYKQYSGSRNGHVAMATAYGIMALLDEMKADEPMARHYLPGVTPWEPLS